MIIKDNLTYIRMSFIIILAYVRNIKYNSVLQSPILEPFIIPQTNNSQSIFHEPYIFLQASKDQYHFFKPCRIPQTNKD